MNTLSIFDGITKISQLNVSDANDFLDLFKKSLSKTKPNKEAIKEKLISLSSKLKDNKKNKIGQLEALKILLARDLDNVIDTLEEFDIKDPEITLNEFYDIFSKEVKKLGFDFEIPPLVIGDDYPKPYQGRSYSAMAFDEEDEKAYGEKYGLKQSIYFKRSRLSPIRSEFILAHEFIHPLSGKADSTHFPYMLDEGICDFFGYYILASKIFPRHYVHNFFIESKNGNKVEWLFEKYVQGAIMAALLYKDYGLKGLVELIKLGRGKIAEVEELILSNKSDKINLPKGDWDEELLNYCNLIISFPKNFVFSPLARLICEEIEEGSQLKQFEKNYNLGELEIVLRDELPFAGPILYHEGEVTCDESKRFIRTNVFRYNIDKKLAKEIKKQLT